MSCDHSSYCTTVIDWVPRSSLTVEVGDYASRETDLEVDKSLKQSWRGLSADQSKSEGYRHEVRSRIIPDSTEIDPEYVWGDEGPIND
jgi:hypothetical protein